MNNYATLYVCPTPIGNLKDITLRVLETLEQADVIAAEDTRHTIKLLNHYDIKKKLISYHEHNTAKMQPILLEMLKSGTTIALVSDAGMPGISDPGSDIISACIKENINVEVLPGANAAITALVASGINTEAFTFIGFLPKKISQAKNLVETLIDEPRTLILYESPHRLVKILEILNNILGDRNIALARELTKIHEQILRLTLSEAITYYSSTNPRGEYVIIIEGAKKEKKAAISDAAIIKTVEEYKNKGFSTKDAVLKASQTLGLSRNAVYDSVKTIL